MKELIEVKLNENLGINAVSARDLYLGIGLDRSNWAQWARLNIEENEYFFQGIDFIQLVTKPSANIPNPPKDYAISIEFAKHITMQARTEKSHEYRNYMIDCEQKNKPSHNISLVQDTASLFPAISLAFQAVGIQGSQLVLAVDKTAKSVTGVTLLGLSGMQLISETKENLLTPSDIGIELGGVSAQTVNKILIDNGYQVPHRDSKNKLYYEVTDQGNEFGEMLPTNKKNSDGTPVTQLKWYSGIVAQLKSLLDKAA